MDWNCYGWRRPRSAASAGVSARVSSPHPRHGARPRFARLRGERDAGVGGAKALITAPLDDLEEGAHLDGVSINLKALTILVAIVEDTVLLHGAEQLGRELVTAIEVGINIR